MRPKPRRVVPYEFVLEELEPLAPYTRPMFGCESVYVEDRIVFILRRKEAYPEDNGVWIATTEEHHASLKPEFPSLRSIQLFGGGPTGWQVLPEDSPDFEEAVYRACALVKAGDPRIGKIPKPRRSRKSPKSKKKPKTRRTKG